MSCTLGLRLYDSQLLFDKLLDSEVNEKNITNSTSLENIKLSAL